MSCKYHYHQMLHYYWEREREAARFTFRIDERKEKLRITFEITLTTRQVVFVTIRIVLDKFHKFHCTKPTITIWTLCFSHWSTGQSRGISILRYVQTVFWASRTNHVASRPTKSVRFNIYIYHCTIVNNLPTLA